MADDATECSEYHLPCIAELERLLANAQRELADRVEIIGDIEQIRVTEGNSVTILCDNPEADSLETQSAVDVCGDFTDWKDERYWGRDWTEALHKAANASRLFNAVDA